MVTCKQPCCCLVVSSICQVTAVQNLHRVVTKSRKLLRLATGWDQLKSIIPFGATKKATEGQQDADHDKAFTVVFTGNSAIHLVANGNGRSRDEWVTAIQDLANGCYNSMLNPDDQEAAQEEA